MLGLALADTSRDGWAFRYPDAVFVLLKGGDKLHNRNLTQKLEVSRAEAVGPTTLLTRFAEELRRAPAAGDFEGAEYEEGNVRR